MSAFAVADVAAARPCEPVSSVRKPQTPTADAEPAPLVVRSLDDSAEPRWEAFVAGHPDAMVFHRCGWRRVIERSFGQRCHFLFAEAAGQLRGVLPLVHLDTRFFGKALVSTGFGVYGGPLTRDTAAREALDAAAIDLARELKVDHLEYRLMAPQHPDWPCQSELYAAFRKALDPDPEKNLLAIPRKQRAMVRKGIKNGLVGEIDDDVDRFFPIYAESVRNHGTPVFTRQFFANIKAEFGDDCEITTVVHAGQPVASVMSYYFRDEVLPYYGGGLDAARETAAFDFMYWDVMRRACERGYRIFDYGRSKRGTGSFSFKKHWGFEPQPLFYEFKLFRGDAIPEVNPLNPKYRLFIAAWKRLPLPIANLIGPHLARQLG